MNDEIPEEPPNPDTGHKVVVEGGTPSSYGKMKTINEDSALIAAYKGTAQICELLVGDRGATLRYYLAAQLLAGVKGWDWGEFKEMVEVAENNPDELGKDWNPYEEFEEDSEEGDHE